MCVNSINVKYCQKHDCSYVQRGSSDRMHCRECTNERNRNRVRSQKAKENKREYDRNYGLKKRLENPDVLKQAQDKYKQTDKYRDWKISKLTITFSNIYCIRCNNNRVYNSDYCVDCSKLLHIINNYDYISVCKHCNKEYGLDVKINNLGKVFQLNRYCSVECNEKSKKITYKKNAKIYRQKRNEIYGKIREDKQWARIYGIKYEPIIRRIVFRKHKYICTSCGVKCLHPNKENYNQSNAATLDHIIPKSKGGSHTYDNVTLLCRSCNTIKSDKIVKDFKNNHNQMELQFDLTMIKHSAGEQLALFK